MSNNDEWQKRHNSELARKQREYNEEQARKRKEQLRADQAASSKKALREAQQRVTKQLAASQTPKPPIGCIFFSVLVIGGLFYWLI